jgi:prephenate dehydratase
MNIAYLGPEATFTHLAVSSCFQDEITAIPYVTIPECMDAAMEGEVDLAVVPLENAIEGSVNLTLDYLIHEQPLEVVGEIIAPIRQHLLVHPCRKNNWQSVKSIQSHPHAIAQCHRFLRKYFKNTPYNYTTSTGSAAKFASENPECNLGVIANEMAAKMYQMEIVKEDIHDYNHNYTRFAILQEPNRKSSFPIKKELLAKEKTSLIVTLPNDRTGALHQVLSAFAWRHINLSKIESRPTKTGVWDYLFIIDIDMKLDDVLIPGAIAEIEAVGCEVKLLGSYGSYQL